ncbi:hypothetical protein Bca101_068630 [Brassica carinata]
MSVLEAYDLEKEESSHEDSQPQPSLLSAASPSHYISRTDEYTLVLKPPFGQYQIIPARGSIVLENTILQPDSQPGFFFNIPFYPTQHCSADHP